MFGYIIYSFAANIAKQISSITHDEDDMLFIPFGLSLCIIKKFFDVGGVKIDMDQSSELVHVSCPCCKNKRLFDADLATSGIISIKCPICKAVVCVTFKNRKLTSTKSA